MTVEKNITGTTLTAAVQGRMDTSTAAAAEEQITADLDGKTELIIDLSGLEYISSAGLRVLLSLQKRMGKQGMTVLNPNDVVAEIFEVTGFNEILHIESQAAKK